MPVARSPRHRTNLLRAVSLTATVLASAALAPAFASPVTKVTNRADIGAVETLSWDAVGKVFNPLAPNPADFLPLSFSVSTGRGLDLNVSIPAPPASAPPPISPPLVFQTLPWPSGIPTNFASGDYLLFSGAQFGGSAFPAPGNAGPISIRFSTPVRGAGAQLAVDDIPSYELYLDVYDIFDNLLDHFSTDGTSSTDLDDSAAFLGAVADSAIIARLVYSSSMPEQALGLNAMSLNHDVPVVPPLLLLIGGMPALLVRRGRTAQAIPTVTPRAG